MKMNNASRITAPKQPPAVAPIMSCELDLLAPETVEVYDGVDEAEVVDGDADIVVVVVMVIDIDIDIMTDCIESEAAIMVAELCDWIATDDVDTIDAVD